MAAKLKFKLSSSWGVITEPLPAAQYVPLLHLLDAAALVVSPSRVCEVLVVRCVPLDSRPLCSHAAPRYGRKWLLVSKLKGAEAKGTKATKKRKGKGK